MRRDPGEWARLSALASLVAFGALLAMAGVLLLVHGLVWEGGDWEPAWLHRAVLLGLQAPFLALPGYVVARVAGGGGWRPWLVALASLALALGVELLGVTSPVGLWAGMVAGTLLGVVWVSLTAAASPDAATEQATGPAGNASAQRWVSTDAVHRRRVPRDVLAPPEGWQVPEALPPRPTRREVGVEEPGHAPDGAVRAEHLPSPDARGPHVRSR